MARIVKFKVIQFGFGVMGIEAIEENVEQNLKNHFMIWMGTVENFKLT